MTMTLLQKWLFASLVCSMLAAASSQTQADNCGSMPKPYEASYSLYRKELLAGAAQVVLERKSDNTYSYRMDTRVKRGMVRPRIKQVSDFTWKNGLIMPDSYRSTAKVSFFKRKESVDFNWEAMQATGTKKRADFELDIEAGMQDKLSIYLVVAQALCKGENAVKADVVSGPLLKPHNYELQETEVLDTKLGKLQTIHLRMGSSSSEKQTDLWLAADVGFLPVKLVYRKKDEITAMKLVEISFSEPVTVQP